MFKLLKNKRLFRTIAFMLVAVFTINIAGCAEPNDVVSGQPGGGDKNYAVGVGDNVDGYTVYSESTFDPMTLDLFMGYLLNGRNFTLVVVPGSCSENCDNDDDEYADLQERVYELDNDDNVLFNQASNGIYKYNEYLGGYENPEEKALLYYVTDAALNDWFDYFDSDDNFMSNATEFLASDTDVAKPSRFKCEDLVNLGNGLNADDFCNKVIKNITTYDEYNSLGMPAAGASVITPSLFSNGKTGGMILFFGFNSIEGYITYDHIINYAGSALANSLEATGCNYTLGNVDAFDYVKIANGDFRMDYDVVDNEQNTANNQNMLLSKLQLLYPTAYPSSVSIDEIKAKLTELLATDYFKSDIISAYTELKMQNLTGCSALKMSYSLIERSILTDHGSAVTNAGGLSAYANSLKNNSSYYSSSFNVWMDEGKQAIYEIVQMLLNFNENKKEEAFNLKFSASVFSRYDEVISLPNTDTILQKTKTDSITKIYSGEKELITQLVEGTAKTSSKITNADTYITIITADGFIIDRGTEDDQITAGAADMLGMSGLLQELIRMDACPNATLAAEVFNMLANLKIVAGAALAITGAVVAAGAAIGLAVAGVIGKLAIVGLATPVPGARIAALVLAVIAGLIALGVGIYTLYQGLKDKARIKGMGASDTNYCKTYTATFNVLFDTMELTIPVYHYEIQKRSAGDGKDAISLYYCEKGDHNQGSSRDNPSDDTCVENGTVVGKPKEVPMYYYADMEFADELDVDGMPIIMFHKERKLVDYIYGATTPEFIVDTLRIWGILAMREIVYKAYTTLSGGNVVVGIDHTTNANSRTMKMVEAKYCYTKEIGINLYDDSKFGGSSPTFCIYPNDAGVEYVANPVGNYYKLGSTYHEITDANRYSRSGEEGSYVYTADAAGAYIKIGENYYYIDDSRYSKQALQRGPNTISINKGYDYSSGQSANAFTLDVTADGSLQYVKDYFSNLYASDQVDVSAIFFASPAYRYGVIKKNQILMKNIEFTGITGYDVDDVGIGEDGVKTKFRITVTHSGGSFTDVGELHLINGTNYFVTDKNVYKIPDIEFGANGEVLSQDVVIVHVAEFVNGKTALQEALAKENTYDKDSEDSWKNMIIYFSDFLAYVVGEKVFADEVERENIYLSATIKDAPQATKIKDDDGDIEECAAGEYVYNHQGVFVKRFKCIADDDVKAKDEKQMIGSYRNGDSDNEQAIGDYNYYNASVNIGWVEIVLKGDGSNALEVKFHFVGDE